MGPCTIQQTMQNFQQVRTVILIACWLNTPPIKSKVSVVQAQTNGNQNPSRMLRKKDLLTAPSIAVIKLNAKDLLLEMDHAA